MVGFSPDVDTFSNRRTNLDVLWRHNSDNKTPMILLGLSGKKQSGKNTVARLIAQHSKGSVYELGFADALKIEVATACGVPLDYLEEQKSRFRPILQWWGTEFRRYDDLDYWIRKVGTKLIESSYKPDVAIITDCRFVNEAEAVRSWNGVMVRVLRTTELQNHDPHSSETALDSYKHDFTLINDGHLGELSANILTLCTKLNIPLK